MNNLKELRKRAGLTQIDVAEKLGVTQPQIYNFERGASRLSYPQMQQISEILHCDTEEIYGDMRSLQEQAEDIKVSSKNNMEEFRKRLGITQREMAEKLNISSPYYCNIENGIKKPTIVQLKQIANILEVDVKDLYREEKPTIEKLSSTVTIDIISATPCCGSGEDNCGYADDVVGKWVMPTRDFRELTFAKPQDVKQMRVTGDSMEPTIKDGDYILTDTSHNTFDVDGIYLVRLMNGLAVKRLQAGLNNITIHSDNKKYQPITAEAGQVVVIGKVIKILNIENV